MNSEEKDQGKPRILLVTTRPIDRTGGAHQRVQGIISELKQCYEVKAFVISDVLTTLLPDGAAFQGDRRGRLFSVTPRWVRHEVSTQQRATIIKCLIAEIEAFDASLVIFSGPGTLPWLTRLEGIPTILDAYDLMWVGIKRKDSRRAIRLKSRLRAKIEEIIARRYERRKYA